jgi:hypothetical protein
MEVLSNIFKKKVFIIVALTFVLLFNLVPISLAAELSNDSYYIVEGDILKADLSKLPIMKNSQKKTIKAIPIKNGYRLYTELNLAPEEIQKDLRVIEFNKKTNEVVVETGVLESSIISKEKASPAPAVVQSYTNTSATYKSYAQDFPGITLNSISTRLNWSYNGSSIGTYSSSYSTYAYRGLTVWWLYYPVVHNQSGNSTFCKADDDATFKNVDWLTSAPTYVSYTDNEIVGYYNGSASGYCYVDIYGESYWLLHYHSTLIRNY